MSETSPYAQSQFREEGVPRQGGGRTPGCGPEVGAGPLSPDATPESVASHRASVALYNMRGWAIAALLMLHSALAYLGSAPAAPDPFDRPPYRWLAYPILDRERWLGFDIFCAWQDVYLMCLMFCLSGVFTWPSLTRDGAVRFVAKRFLRLGAPFALALAVVMPVALYPSYRMTTAAPSVSDYVHQYLSLPFVPNGPMWFLWLLLALTVLAAGSQRFWLRAAPRIVRVANVRAAWIFAAWLGIAVAAYVPLALAFTPWSWTSHGALAFQLSRPVLYAAYYFAGVAMGALGLGRGLLSEDGIAAKRWRAWLAAAIVSLLLWMGSLGLAMRLGDAAPLLLHIAGDASYALAGLCSALFVLGVCMRYGATARWAFIGALSDNALGVYLLHYAPVVWLQYALLSVSWPAPLKWATVFAGVVTCCLGATAAARALSGAIFTKRNRTPKRTPPASTSIVLGRHLQGRPHH
jgi:glucans biosynthesis protein C